MSSTYRLPSSSPSPPLARASSSLSPPSLHPPPLPVLPAPNSSPKQPIITLTTSPEPVEQPSPDVRSQSQQGSPITHAIDLSQRRANSLSLSPPTVNLSLSTSMPSAEPSQPSTTAEVQQAPAAPSGLGLYHDSQPTNTQQTFAQEDQQMQMQSLITQQLQEQQQQQQQQFQAPPVLQTQLTWPNGTNMAQPVGPISASWPPVGGVDAGFVFGAQVPPQSPVNSPLFLPPPPVSLTSTQQRVYISWLSHKHRLHAKLLSQSSLSAREWKEYNISWEDKLLQQVKVEKMISRGGGKGRLKRVGKEGPFDVAAGPAKKRRSNTIHSDMNDMAHNIPLFADRPLAPLSPQATTIGMPRMGFGHRRRAMSEGAIGVSPPSLNSGLSLSSRSLLPTPLPPLQEVPTPVPSLSSSNSLQSPMTLPRFTPKEEFSPRASKAIRIPAQSPNSPLKRRSSIRDKSDDVHRRMRLTKTLEHVLGPKSPPPPQPPQLGFGYGQQQQQQWSPGFGSGFGGPLQPSPGFQNANGWGAQSGFGTSSSFPGAASAGFGNPGFGAGWSFSQNSGSSWGNPGGFGADAPQMEDWDGDVIMAAGREY